MIRRIGLRFAAFFRATTPDPFVLAIALTVVVFALAAGIEGAGPVQIIEAWQGDKGFWSLLAFGMQMVLILVTGHALASTPVVSRAIRAVARLPRTGSQAAALVSVVAMSTALLNWGLGLIVGAILAREVGRVCAARGIRAHYPLLAAAGYTGLMCWHGGISGTAPLMMTTRPNVVKFLGEELADQVGTLPFTQTVLSVPNAVVSLGLVLIVPLLCAAMAPGPADSAESAADYGVPVEDPAEEAVDTAGGGGALTVPDRIERSAWLPWIIGLPMAVAVVLWFRDRGIEKLDPDVLNLAFLTLGLVLHGSVRRYVASVTEAVRGAAGIVLQFPFYAGIMGVMRVTGLGSTFARAMASVGSAKAFTVTTFLSASVINLFVPSGGGQWAVQGPVVVEAARSLGVPLELGVLAVAYGDQLTNMLQPFWALPLLAITGVRARDIIGYTTVLMLAGGLWIAGCLLFLTP